MALEDPYASPAEYRGGTTGSNSEADDDALLEDLRSMTRILDYELGVVEGAFNAHAGNVSRYFDGSGSELLRLRDSRGRAVPLRSVASEGIAIDSGLNGDWDAYTFDLTDAWAIGDPPEAPLSGEPYWRLRLLPLSNAVASVGGVYQTWPLGRRNIRITGAWGHAAVPGAIKRLVIQMTRDLRDRLATGSTGTMQLAESGIIVRDETWRSILAIKAAYGHKLLPVAF